VRLLALHQKGPRHGQASLCLSVCPWVEEVWGVRGSMGRSEPPGRPTPGVGQSLVRMWWWNPLSHSVTQSLTASSSQPSLERCERTHTPVGLVWSRPGVPPLLRTRRATLRLPGVVGQVAKTESMYAPSGSQRRRWDWKLSYSIPYNLQCLLNIDRHLLLFCVCLF